MFQLMLEMLISEFANVLSAVASMLAVVVGIGVLLVAFKKYKQAVFLADPSKSERFQKWQAMEGHNFDSVEESAKAYLETVNAAAIYDLQHGRKERKRELFYERRDAYRYIKALDRMDYRGFDDEQPQFG